VVLITRAVISAKVAERGQRAAIKQAEYRHLDAELLEGNSHPQTPWDLDCRAYLERLEAPAQALDYRNVIPEIRNRIMMIAPANARKHLLPPDARRLSIGLAPGGDYLLSGYNDHLALSTKNGLVLTSSRFPVLADRIWFAQDRNLPGEIVVIKG